MTERRTIGPDREPPPQATLHNLAKPPKLAPPLGVGRDVDALALPSFEEQKRRYLTAQHLLVQLAKDHATLVARAKAAQRVSFPSPGAGGSRSSSISDPTSAAALRPRILDPAERAFDEVETAIKHLRNADRYRERALRMDEASGPALEAALKKLAEEQAAAAEGEPVERRCPSCKKVGMETPRGSDKEVGQDSDLCGWCHWFTRTYGREVPRRLLNKRKDGGRIYEHDIVQALQPQKPGS